MYLNKRRYLIWVTQFTPRDRNPGWEREDWNSITPKDLKLFFAVLLKYPMSFATAFYIAINQLSPEQLVKRMGLGGLNSIKPAVFLNILRIIVIAKDLKEWRDWPIDSVIPRLIHFDAIQRLMTPTDRIKIDDALSKPSQEYLNSVSQGTKTPHYYRTAKHHLSTLTNGQGPQVAQPMSNRHILTAHQQPIPPTVLQPVGQSLSYPQPIQPTPTAQQNLSSVLLNLHKQYKFQQ